MVRRALCIGINDYPDEKSRLFGCVNDALDWKNVLETRGFEVEMLLDSRATKAAIEDAVSRLVTGFGEGGTAVITFSGHGSQAPDEDGDEPDALDEVLCPYDVTESGPIVDDWLYGRFRKAPAGVSVLFISDSCHSGSVTRDPPPILGASPLPRARWMPPERFLSRALTPEQAFVPRPVRARRPSELGGMLLFAGCKDHEKSYDATFDGRPNGAFTHAAIAALETLPAEASYADWFKQIRSVLPSRRHPQTPRLTASRRKGALAVLA